MVVIRHGGTYREKCEAMRLRLMAEIDRKGRLDAYTSVGSYPIVYYSGDEDPLCAVCAELLTLSQEEHISVRGIYEEGPILECEECGASIESAHGEPERTYYPSFHHIRTDLPAWLEEDLDRPGDT